MFDRAAPLTVVAALAGFGCDRMRESPLPVQPSPSSKAPETRTPLLPAMIGAPEDGWPRDAPSLCAWAASVDAIVVGNLSSITLVDSPAIEVIDGLGNWRWASTCPRGGEPALVLDITIVSTIRGSLSGRVSAHIGRDHRILFRPMPIREADGSLGWLGNTNAGAPLATGQLIGLALHYLPDHDAWSLMGEAIFAVDASGTISFQTRQGDNVDPAPAGADGLTVAQLASSAAACASSTESDARRDWVWRAWGPTGRDPPAYLSAWCFQSEQTPTGICTSDADCAANLVCVRGACGEPGS